MTEKLSNEIIKQIQEYDKSATIKEMAEALNLSTSTIHKYREKKQEEIKDVFTKDETKKLNMIQQYSPKELEEILYRLNINEKTNIDEIIWEKWYLKFWLLSDTHYWNKMCANDEIGEFMDKAKDEWVECFMHAWDFVDWDNVYTGHVYELDKLWFDEQLKNVIENYPDTWLPTYAISGNHDESFLKKSWGDILKAISLVRKDIINLWFYDARIKLNWVDVNLHHGGWSMSYAKSYKIQKLLENIDPNNQPNVFAAGHRHAAVYLFYRKIHSFLPGAFLKENLLAKRFNLDNTIWGWVVEIEIDEKWWSKIWMKFIKI